MEACVGAIGFFFDALAAGLSHFSDIESAAATPPPDQANMSSAKTDTIKTAIRKCFINLL